MDTLLENLTDKLIGSSSERKSDKFIRSTHYLTISRDFNKLKSFWGKACFLTYLQLSKDKSILGCGLKLERVLTASDPQVFLRSILPLIEEIKREHFIYMRPSAKILDKVLERLTEYGADEFLILCKTIRTAGHVVTIQKVSIPLGTSEAYSGTYDDK